MKNFQIKLKNSKFELVSLSLCYAVYLPPTISPYRAQTKLITPLPVYHLQRNSKNKIKKKGLASLALALYLSFGIALYTSHGLQSSRSLLNIPIKQSSKNPLIKSTKTSPHIKNKIPRKNPKNKIQPKPIKIEKVLIDPNIWARKPLLEKSGCARNNSMYMIFHNQTSPRRKLSSFVLFSSSSCCFAFLFGCCTLLMKRSSYVL